MDDSKAFVPKEKYDRNQTMMGFTGEKDYEIAPLSSRVLHWHHFCTDLYSQDRNFNEVSDIAAQFSHKFVDLRPYIIEQPYAVLTTD